MRRCVIAMLVTMAGLASAPALADRQPPCYPGQLGPCQGGPVLPPPLTHAVLVNPAGQSVGGLWRRWVDESKVPTLARRVVVRPVSACYGGVVYEGLPGATACSWSTPPPALAVSAGDGARDALYFELGHLFDTFQLTGADRRYLAFEWGDQGRRWANSHLALQHGAEDGLTALFAVIYADCAEGVNDQGAWIGVFVPVGVGLSSPVASPRIDTCAFIRRVANHRAM